MTKKVGMINKSSNGRAMLQCRSSVNRTAITRRVIDGVENIIVESFTLPDNIVMNGILYPSEEVDASFHTLDRTLAPVEHPSDGAGNYISATDPIAINNFYAGAHNVNSEKISGRVRVEKHINVQEALKTDRGKRLLDRINDVETNPLSKPIHTSVGVFIVLEELDSPRVNHNGDSYSLIARDMVFDHDAILLDSDGAATPDDGVGIAVNSGQELSVLKFNLCEEQQTPEVNSSGNTIDESLDASCKPKPNHSRGDIMRELILSALKDAGVDTDGMSDEQILIANKKMIENSKEVLEITKENVTEKEVDVAAIVANAMLPLSEEIASLKQQVTKYSVEAHEKNAELVGNSDKYPGIDVDTAKLLPQEKLSAIAANCVPSHGIPFTTNADKSDDRLSPTEMPD